MSLIARSTPTAHALNPEWPQTHLTGSNPEVEMSVMPRTGYFVHDGEIMFVRLEDDLTNEDVLYGYEQMRQAKAVLETETPETP